MNDTAKSLELVAKNKAKRVKLGDHDSVATVIEASERPINWFSSNVPVNKMALLNKDYGYALQVVADVLHAEYLRANDNISGEQSQAFRKALDDFLSVFTKAEEDVYQNKDT